MNSKNITQIKVGGNRIGIIGLKSVLEEITEFSGEISDDEIKKILIERLSKKNYISSGVKNKYETAFFREYCKYTGRPVEAERNPGIIEIKVLGEGCARCDKLENDIMGIVAEMKVPADIEHVKDIKEIAAYGVMGSPALVVNGEVKAVGSIPKAHEIKKWINNAIETLK